MFAREPNPALERVSFELKAKGVKREARNPLRSGIHSRGYLPHVKHEGAAYFVTFRLADSLPKAVLMKFQQERALALQKLLQADGTSDARSKTQLLAEIELAYRRNVERFLDKGVGECLLARAELASLVTGVICHFHEQRYVLGAWVVMPNHVHAVVWPMPNNLLSDIVRNWKGYSAREANRILGRTKTPFWQREPFDHWIRNDVERDRICRYIINNPVKAGLCKTPEAWRWSSAWREPEHS